MIYQARLIDGNKEMRMLPVGDDRVLIHIAEVKKGNLASMEVKVADWNAMVTKCFEKIEAEEAEMEEYNK